MFYPHISARLTNFLSFIFSNSFYLSRFPKTFWKSRPTAPDHVVKAFVLKFLFICRHKINKGRVPVNRNLVAGKALCVIHIAFCGSRSRHGSLCIRVFQVAVRSAYQHARHGFIQYLGGSVVGVFGGQTSEACQEAVGICIIAEQIVQLRLCKAFVFVISLNIIHHQKQHTVIGNAHIAAPGISAA